MPEDEVITLGLSKGTGMVLAGRHAILGWWIVGVVHVYVFGRGEGGHHSTCLNHLASGQVRVSIS